MFYVFLYAVVCLLLLIPIAGHLLDGERRVYFGPFTSQEVPKYNLQNFHLLQKKIKELEEIFKV